MKIASFLPFAGLFTAFSHALPSLVEREASPRVIGPEGSSDVPACWKTLSCSFADIQASSMTSRSSYVSYMQSTQFIPLKATNKFNAVIAVIDFFVEKGLGAPGTWVSYVDAGIVEAIQLGGAYALGMSKDPGTNLGATKWTAYFNSLKANKLQSRDVRESHAPWRSICLVSRTDRVCSSPGSRLRMVDGGTDRDNAWQGHCRRP